MPVARQYAVVGLLAFISLLVLFHNPYYAPLNQYIPTFGSGRVELPTQVNDDYGDYSVAPDTLHSHFADVGEYDPTSKVYPETNDHFNQHVLRDLHHCIAVNNCGKNQKKIVIIVGEWVTDAIVSALHLLVVL